MPCHIKKPFGEVETRELMGGTEANSVFIHVGSLIFSYMPLSQYLIADALPVYYAGRGGEDALCVLYTTNIASLPLQTVKAQCSFVCRGLKHCCYLSPHPRDP